MGSKGPEKGNRMMALEKAVLGMKRPYERLEEALRGERNDISDNQEGMYVPDDVQWSLTYPDPTYPDTFLGTNPHSSTESVSLIRKISYPDSQSVNGGVQISKARL